MAPPLLTLQDIHLGFGGAALLEAVELMVSPRDRLCLVGRNGSGKSTLLKIAAGFQEPDRGSRFVQPGVGLRYLPQAPDFTGFATVLDYVAAGLGDGDDPYPARAMLGQFGLRGDEAPQALSGGEVQRAALARVLAPKPDVLLLDEPTNHLDLPAIEWLEETLKSMSAALVLISHDRRFLETLAAATLWLDRGVIRRLDRGFAHFEAWRDEIFENERRDRHKLDRKIARENDWLRYGVTARRKRNQGRLRALRALRREKRDQRPATGTVKLAQTEGALSGKLIADAEGIGKSYGGRALVKDFSIRIKRGSRLGVVGPNGAGKTTLLNMLTGLLAPDTGAVRLGANLEMITLDQRRESLDPRQTLAHALTGGEGEQNSAYAPLRRDFCPPGRKPADTSPHPGRAIPSSRAHRRPHRCTRRRGTGMAPRAGVSASSWNSRFSGFRAEEIATPV
ncbi:MAG: ABC-F family ATP-binding cassette domain-containing protein, partial [Proteobacteria bacterium]|nr:ABC-F family ATP-binding cassette domain-containing protein [Pseudomonadota bacterium]